MCFYLLRVNFNGAFHCHHKAGGNKTTLSPSLRLSILVRIYRLSVHCLLSCHTCARACRSLSAVPLWNVAEECSRAQQSGVYFIGCLFRSVKHATQGPCGAMCSKPSLPLSLLLSPSVNIVYIESVSFTSLCRSVIHPVRHCKQHLYMFINTAQPL